MSNRQLTLPVRYQISALWKMGLKKKEIAEHVGFHPATIGREIKRNSREDIYDPDRAQKFADMRRSEPRAPRKIDELLEVFIEVCLELGDTPEQMSAYLLVVENIKLSAQSIYNWINEPYKKREKLQKMLPRANASRKARNKKKTYIDKKESALKPSINDRPKEIDERGRVGDLEIDLIVGKNHKSSVLTICDRMSLYTMAAILPDQTSEVVEKKLLELLLPYKEKIHSITSDNGSEFSNWKSVSTKLGCKYYFCNPYHSWERGTIENTNGIIRRSYPKKTDFNLVDEKEFQFRIDLMNFRLRKRIGFKTPDELFHKRESIWKTMRKIAL